MKCWNVNLRECGLPRAATHAKIAIICCLHMGARAQMMKKALEWRDWVMSEPHHFAMGLGDDMENALPGDEVHNSMMWDQVRSPEDQFRDAADFWRPLAEKKKLILSHDSNHAYRSEAKTGRSVAKELNIFLQGQYKPKAPSLPDSHPEYLPRWARWQALTRISAGKQTYTFHSWHGIGNGCTPEAALRKCRSMAVQHHADVYCMGHAHNRISWSDNYTQFTGNGREAEFRQRHFAVTGGFLGWHDSYAERTGLAPNRIGAVVVSLGTKAWDVKISS